MQQKMMMMMPVVFTFMFLAAPSGLVIYWLTSNVIGIGQQLVTNRIAGPPRVHQVRPPAERQVKKVAVATAAGEGSENVRAAPTAAPKTRPGPGKGARRSRRKGR